MESQLKNEIEIMYKIDHKHIIKLYKVLDDEAHIYLILEFAKNGQLYQRMNKKGRLDETTTKKMIREMISALEYLHTRSPPIIHRDIKPENILLDEEDHIKLAGKTAIDCRFWLVELLWAVKEDILWNLRLLGTRNDYEDRT